MPSLSPTGQPGPWPADWFATPPGRALLDSEQALVAGLLDERSALPWLWIAPQPPASGGRGRGLALAVDGAGWRGAVACGLPLPLPGDTLGTVVLQHVATRDAAGRALLEECARILAPGGRLCLLTLNPLSPYRWRWRGRGLGAAEPLTWRRHLRRAGLQPEPVSRGVGPTWAPRAEPLGQDGPGLRAAYLLRAERRTLPLTPIRGKPALRMPAGAALG